MKTYSILSLLSENEENAESDPEKISKSGYFGCEKALSPAVKAI